MFVTVLAGALFSACVKPDVEAVPMDARSATNAPPLNRGMTTPSWHHGHRAAVSICNLPQTSDYILKVAPIQIGSPYELELSPWPGQPGWVTPIKWQVLQIVLTNPLPGKQLPVLSSTITTLMAADYKDATTTKFIGVAVVDGQFLVGEVYSPSAAGWQLDVGLDKFATESNLLSAILTASNDSKCARKDVLGMTRAANEARLLATGVHPPASPLSQGDAGNTGP